MISMFMRRDHKRKTPQEKISKIEKSFGVSKDFERDFDSKIDFLNFKSLVLR